ncbi:MAG: tetratricopeptide repeat protein [Bacteroidales bacterium]|nr:tetratricopeptide repeat protein [Bacteroidales bacterium]
MNINNLIISGKYKEALEEINSKKEKGEATNYFQEALVLYHLKEYEKAENIYEELYKNSQDSGDLINSLALVYKALNKTDKAFLFFQLAFEKGSNQSIYEILNMLFERKGICDYLNCKNSCCNNVILKGVAGKIIKDIFSFERLMANPNQNHGWQKVSENKKGEWIFACKHVDDKNVCKIYDSRPQICRDYPSGIFSLKPECSYYFELIENLPKFESKSTLAVVLDILEAFGYQKEKQKLESNLKQ